MFGKVGVTMSKRISDGDGVVASLEFVAAVASLIVVDLLALSTFS